MESNCCEFYNFSAAGNNCIFPNVFKNLAKYIELLPDKQTPISKLLFVAD